MLSLEYPKYPKQATDAQVSPGTGVKEHNELGNKRNATRMYNPFVYFPIRCSRPHPTYPNWDIWDKLDFPYFIPNIPIGIKVSRYARYSRYQLFQDVTGPPFIANFQHNTFFHQIGQI